ncbi:hypothetical protein, partial [Papillibacter cinnamivorans]
METMKIKFEDVLRPARQTPPSGSMPVKEDNDAGQKTGRFHHWVHRISVSGIISGVLSLRNGFRRTVRAAGSCCIFSITQKISCVTQFILPGIRARALLQKTALNPSVPQSEGHHPMDRAGKSWYDNRKAAILPDRSARLAPVLWAEPQAMPYTTKRF